MKYLELFAVMFMVYLAIVNLVMLTVLPLFGVTFGVNLFVNLLIPAALAGVTVEKQMNQDRQMNLFYA
jgi:hypothetical protein